MTDKPIRVDGFVIVPPLSPWDQRARQVSVSRLVREGSNHQTQARPNMIAAPKAAKAELGEG